MSTRRVVAGAAVVAALAGGATIAVAGGGKDSEQAVLDSAAKKLGVTSDELRKALGAAEDEQLDAAVKEGRLTQKQADAIKEHRARDGHVLGFGGPRGRHGGPPGGPGFGGPGFGGPAGGLLDAAADALGLSRDELFERFRDGKSLADIAKAQGKSVDDVKAAVKAAAAKELDQAVKDGRLTESQRDEMLDHLDDAIDHFGERPPGFGHRGGRGGHFGPPPMP